MNMRLSDKNPLKVAVVAAVVIALAMVASLNLKALAFWNSPSGYSAYLTNASGLVVGDKVQVRGVRVGEIKSLEVKGNTVRVDFDVDGDLKLGSQTKAAVKVLNPLGSVFLQLDPQGSGELTEPIPTARTAVSMSLLGDLGEISDRVEKIDVKQVQKALDVTTTNLSATSKEAVTKALSGLTEFSGTLAGKSEEIHRIVTEGSELAEILSGRKDQLVNLVGQGEVLLQVMQERKDDISALVRGTRDLSHEIAAILEVNQEELNPMLRDLQKISDILAKESDSISAALPQLAKLSEHVAAATGNGSFLDVVVPNGLLPDDLIAQCGDGAYPAPSKPVVGCRP